MPINITGSSLTTGLNCTVTTAPYGSMSFNGLNQTVIYSYFDGFNLATGNPDFSIELWFYARSYGGVLIDNGGIVSYSYSQYQISLSEVGILSAQLGMAGGTQGGYHSTYIGFTSSAITLNTWNHVALVRNGSYASVFLNGVIFGTVNVGASFYPSGFLSNDSATYLGGFNSIYGTTAFFYGYISNVRIVKYASAYNYDNNFVPPSIPFSSLQAANTNGIPSNTVGSTQTTFLLNTLNNSTVLQNGSAYITTGTQTTGVVTTISSVLIPTISSSSLNPFPGSIFFNGTSQYLSIPSSANLNFSTGDFTVEAWVNTTAANAGTFFIISSTGTGGFFFGYNTNPGDAPIGYGWGRTSVAWDYTTGVTKSDNVWQHLAVTRSGTSMKIFVNGVQAGTTQTNSTAYDLSVTSTVIGWQQLSYYFPGYMSNVRVVKGTAVYTSNFTPPTGIFPNTQPSNLFGNPSEAITGTQTSLLLKNTYDSNFLVDYSVNSFTITNNGTAVSSTLNPFNGYYGIISNPGSAQFNGTSQYLSLPSNTAFDQDGIFTWECWFYPTNITNGYLWAELQYGFMGLGIGSGGIPGKLYVDMSFVGPVIISNTTITVNAWYHVALVYDGTNTKLYLNGNLEGTAATGGSASGAPLWIGNYDNGPLYYSGYISNFRIVKGVAVYTSAFTPPAAPLQSSQAANQSGAPSAAVTSSQTTLLLNTAFGNDFLFDTSINKLTVTNVGTATSSALDPF